MKRTVVSSCMGQTRSKRFERNILDIAPTLLNHMELEIPDNIKREPIRSN